MEEKKTKTRSKKNKVALPIKVSTIDTLKKIVLNDTIFLKDFGTDSIKNIELFFEKIKNKQKKIRVAYFGDSMIEGDLVTQDFMNGLHRHFTNSSAKLWNHQYTNFDQQNNLNTILQELNHSIHTLEFFIPTKHKLKYYQNHNEEILIINNGRELGYDMFPFRQYHSYEPADLILDPYILGKTLLETLTKGDIQRLISKHTYGTQKQLINCINNIWYFAINSGLLGDNPPVNPTKDYKINKEKIKDFPAVKHNKVIFNKEITRVIWEELINCRDQFPFRAECLLFMLVTGTRQSETLRIKKADVDINKNIITLQKAKSGKTEVVMITPAVIKVLRYLKDLENRESYQWSKFTPWLFSTTQFRVADFDYYKDTEKGQSYIQSENTQLGNPRDCWEYVRNQIRKNYPEFNGAPKNFRKNYSAAAVKILKNSSEAIKLTRHQLTSTLEKHYLGNNMEEIADNANLVSNNWFDFASNQ
jgi:integrase